WPVGHRIAAVLHALGFAEGRGDGAAIEMIASHHDGSLQSSLLHHIIHGEAELRALAVAQPADARGQSLKLDPLAGEVDPATQDVVVGKEFEDKIVSGVNVRGLAGE